MGVPAAAGRRAARAGRGRLPARSRSWRTALGARLAAAVAAHDAADPLDPGLPVEAARRALDLPDARLVEVVLRHAGAARRPGADGGAHPARRPGRRRSPAPGCPRPCARRCDELRADLKRRPFDAPEAARLAELGLGPRQLASLVRSGELLRVADGVVLLPGADDRAVEVLADARPRVHPQRRPAGAGHDPPGRRPAAGAAGPHRPHRAHRRRRPPARPAVTPRHSAVARPPGGSPEPRGSTVTRDARHALEPARRPARRPAERRRRRPDHAVLAPARAGPDRDRGRRRGRHAHLPAAARRRARAVRAVGERRAGRAGAWTA